MYGGPPMPWDAPTTAPAIPQQQVFPFLTVPNGVRFVVDPVAKKRIRVTSKKDDDGSLRLKVYVDGVLISEAITDGGTTVTIETEI